MAASAQPARRIAPAPTLELDRSELWLFPILLYAVFSFLWLDYRGFWLDDAFITFRYAQNLATGLGPVFNAGEFVEGYTSFLWMLLSGAAFALFRDTLPSLLAIKAAGLFLGLWTLYRTWTFPGPRAPARRTLAVLLATHPVFIANYGDGMETPLYIALTLECARAFLRPPGVGAGALTGLLCAGLAWTRPEAMLLIAGLPLLRWAAAARSAPGARDAGTPGALGWTLALWIAALLPLAIHVVWRLSFYGEPLPNTYYAKATGALAPRLARGLDDLASFAIWQPRLPPVSLWIALGFAVLGTAGGLRRGWGAAERAYYGVLWLLIGMRVAFDLWAGSEFMGSFRFLAPTLPLLFILADDWARTAWRGRMRAAIAALCLLGLGFNLSGHRALVAEREHYRSGLEAAHIALGHWLRERHPPDTLVALGDAGAIPFFSGLPSLDLWGLGDATIAHLPGEYGNRAGAVPYAMEREPEVLVIWNLAPVRGAQKAGRLLGAQPFDRALALHPDFKTHYRFVREFTFAQARGGRAGYYLDVFERVPPHSGARER